MLFKSKNIEGLVDEKLMEFVAMGNTEAFNEIYNRYHKRLHYYFFRMLGHSRDNADDFLQELFFKVLDKAKSFNSNYKFSTWIFSIAHNMCKNEYRKNCNKQFIEHNENFENGANHINELDSDKKQFIEKLYKELDKLDESHRTAFILRYREGFGIKEIGLILNCAEGTIKSRLHYTTKKLADKLKAFNPIN